MTGSHRPYLRQAIDRALAGAGLGVARLADDRIVLFTLDPFRAFVLTGDVADPVIEGDIDGALPVRAVVLEGGDLADALSDTRVELANVQHNLRACVAARQALEAEHEDALRQASRHRAQLREAEAKAEKRAERRAFIRLLRTREVAESERQRQFDAAVLRELRRRAVRSGDLFIADNSTRAIAAALHQPVDAVSAALKRLIAAEQVVVVHRRRAGGHGIPADRDPGLYEIPGLMSVLRAVHAADQRIGDADRFVLNAIHLAVGGEDA